MSWRESGIPVLEALDRALEDGDIEEVRRIVGEASGDDVAILQQELGYDALEGARRSATRRRRGGKRGKVLVLPGIMGTELDAVDRSGDADRIWINILRLLAGRIADLELTPDGHSAKEGVHVRTAGIHGGTYVPMLVELAAEWDVRPFPFDWREDIDRSADRLSGELGGFGAGDPVHLVAHSMGGIVARRMIARHPDVWKAIDDPRGHARGGRLVMLGTPNRGSFSIPLVLVGQEKLVKLLDLGDLPDSTTRLMEIIASFGGLVQLMPSPLVKIEGSDHADLYDATHWGTRPVHQRLLDRARELHRDLEEVRGAERFVYVAGFDRPTPFKTRIVKPGEIAVGETRDGDGRVPHMLGLLDGVNTFWVDETHSSLAKNRQVLDAITDLLGKGTTSRLPTRKPKLERGAGAPAPTVEPGRQPTEDELPKDADALVKWAKASARGPRRGRRRGEPDLPRAEVARLEEIALDGFVATRGGGAGAPPPPAPSEPAGRSQGIAIEVAWGDVTKVVADVHCVGHYQGVIPQNAEEALDRAVSGVADDVEIVADGTPTPTGANAAMTVPRSRLVITRHTRQGLLRGTLGEVTFFPWGAVPGVRPAGRLVAVGGMGPPGSFDLSALVRLMRQLVVAIWALPRARTVCTVLIGSGEGTLSTRDAVRGLLRGVDDAVAETTSDSSLAGVRPVTKIVIAEYERSRAFEIQGALAAELEAREKERKEREQQAKAAGRREPVPPVAYTLAKEVTVAQGGGISPEESMALLLEAAVTAKSTSSAGKAAAALVRGVQPSDVRERVRDALRRSGGQAGSFDVPRFRVVERELDADAGEDEDGAIPVRLTFTDDVAAIRVAAIHAAATVPERFVKVDRKLVDELIERTTDPEDEEIDGVTLPEVVGRLLVPVEFRSLLEGGPSYVFDVDRSMARVHWEYLSRGGEGELAKPVSVRFPVARQLRTTYSSAPLPPARPDRRLKALVIGDPGDPAKGESLPGARAEAIRVAELLGTREGIEVEARIGAPTVPREGPLAAYEPANRLDVLALLLGGDYDLVHYAGHGDFDAEHPDRVGWVFASGLITPGELGQVERVPAIVVANACLTALTSQQILDAKRRGTDEPRSEAGLLPSLADEFFRLGVRNYIGTAWEVNDLGATLFAETFYDRLLPLNGGSRPFGRAVLAARTALWDSRQLFGPLWAAYQHYGDPTSEARLSLGAGGDG